MATSYNGWSASPTLPLRKLEVEGVGFLPGIRDDDDVAAVLEYVATQYHKRVEPLMNPGCWGFNYRANRNSNNLSNHASGTAIDVNAPQHPNGVATRRTFRLEQINEIHKILFEVDHVVRWGGDYSVTPDSMHFEINASRPEVARVAKKLRDRENPLAQFTEADLRRIVRQEVREVLKPFAEREARRHTRTTARLSSLRERVKAGVEEADLQPILEDIDAIQEDLAADSVQDEDTAVE
jgi:hypothetical protein